MAIDYRKMFGSKMPGLDEMQRRINGLASIVQDLTDEQVLGFFNGEDLPPRPDDALEHYSANLAAELGIACAGQIIAEHDLAEAKDYLAKLKSKSGYTEE